MKLDNIFYATQYYRSPTPLEDEWEKDLFLMGQYNLNTIQIRINWRNNERVENQYTFDDVDKLFDLAEKHNKKVIVKFLLECAPSYIFEKYEGTRIGPNGEKYRAGYHGAFYGGWQPCFSNPKIRERAVLFVKKIVERYKDRPNLVFYNAWNEIRNRPSWDCFCPHCRKNFQEYLKNKFKTIEALNKFYGATEESFETIDLPSMPHGYWDILEFKRFKGSVDTFDKVKMVVDTIRSLDLIHPIVSHTGICNAFQASLDDTCDDFNCAKAVDGFGTSLPFSTLMATLDNRLNYHLLNDYMRSVDKDYFIYEMYPGLGMFKYDYDTNYDIEYKLYTALGCGSKGINFWQYRSERVAHENDCAGLMHMDGSPRAVINSVREVGDFINHYGKRLLNAYPKQTEIAIISDSDSNLMSQIEDSSGVDYSFSLYGPVFAYRDSLQGFYKLVRKNGYDCDFINSRNIKDIFKYKVIYFPYIEMVSDEIRNEISKYIAIGGRVIFDEGFAIRDLNTWMNPYDMNLKPFLNIRLDERRRCEEAFSYNDKVSKFYPYKSSFKLDNESEVILRLSDNTPGLQLVRYGRGDIYLFGFSFAASSVRYGGEVFNDILNDVLLANLKISKKEFDDINNGLEARTLIDENNKNITFLYNTSDEDKTININKNIDFVYNGELTDNKLVVFAKKVAVIFEK